MPESIAAELNQQAQPLLSLLNQGLAELSLQALEHNASNALSYETCIQALSAEQRSELVQLVLLIKKWNKVHNLTAVRDEKAMIGRHLLDSLSVLPWIPESSELPELLESQPCDVVDVLDVGSGAGLPVIPLAIARPQLRYLSVESNGKKTGFQQYAKTVLGLKHLTVKQTRIEDAAIQARIVVSRAFTAPAEFLQVVAPLCIAGGQVIIMLGQKERLPAVLPEPFTLLSVHRVQVPQCESTRHVAICRRA